MMTPSRQSVVRLTSIIAFATLAACGNNEAPRIQGYVEGEFVYVSSPVAGPLMTLAIERGAQVERGTMLFEIDSTSARAQRDAAQARLAQAQASLHDAQKGLRPSELESIQAQYIQVVAAQSLAESELKRQQNLLTSVGGTSKQDVDKARSARDQAKAQVAALSAQLKTARLGARNDQVLAASANRDAMQAQLAQAEWELSQATQSAVTTAVVADTFYRPGEWIAAGHPVVALLPPSNIKVRAYVPETQLSVLRVGAAAKISLDGRATPLNGTISFISPRLEFTPPVVYSQTMRSKFVALIELVFDPAVAATLHPGQPVDVQFIK